MRGQGKAVKRRCKVKERQGHTSAGADEVDTLDVAIAAAGKVVSRADDVISDDLNQARAA